MYPLLMLIVEHTKKVKKKKTLNFKTYHTLWGMAATDLEITASHSRRCICFLPLYVCIRMELYFKIRLNCYYENDRLGMSSTCVLKKFSAANRKMGADARKRLGTSQEQIKEKQQKAMFSQQEAVGSLGRILSHCLLRTWINVLQLCNDQPHWTNPDWDPLKEWIASAYRLDTKKVSYE